MGKLTIKLRYVFMISFAVSFQLKASAQVFNQTIADNITQVEDPYLFLKKIEQIGVKEIGNKELDSACKWLERSIISIGYKPSIQKFLYFSDTLRNIEFTKKGTQDSVIIVCAHYDSRTGPGVNDNGSGDFALYQIAKLLKPTITKYTVKFIYFSGEENNLLGSNYFVSKMNKDSVKIKFVLNLDQLGGTIGEDNTGIKCERDETSFQKTKSNYITQVMANIYSLYTNLNPIITPAYSSDYISFRDSGYIITGVYQYSPFPYYHSSSDVLQYMDLTSLISITKGAVAAILHFSEVQIPVSISSNNGISRDISVYYSNKSLFVKSNSNYSVIIFNGLGQQVLVKNQNQTEQILSLANLKTGIYFAYIQSGNKQISHKFIIEP